ncbi:MAG: GNAT family N-acetyltransferase [Spirochaetes bacterium]|jgi:GNAT superfamily N-acetyltransferase|nr:GNAT family N-acetyltransferase [Spirochaetota bacterium]
MQFELTPELADRIIFAMEDQNEDFILDTETGDLLSVEEMEELEEEAEDDPDRFVSLPDWTPAHGFRLMERFAEELRNPVYQEKLREALSGGRGVFRRFKDTVKEREELERRWHHFKEQAMQEVVTDWYNDLRETWGLERVAVETAETEDLVLSDFTIRRVGEGDHGLLEEVLRAAEEQRREPGRGARGDAAPGPADAPVAAAPPALAFVAEAPDGEIAGVAAGAAGADALAAADAADAAATAARAQGGSLRIDTLYVRPTFRGLGLGRLLLERIVEGARKEGWAGVSMELSGRGLVLDETAAAMGFRTVAKRVSLDLS